MTNEDKVEENIQTAIAAILSKDPSPTERALAVALQEALDGLYGEMAQDGPRNPGERAFEAVDRVAIALKAAGLFSTV